jgi:hypothetical protein
MALYIARATQGFARAKLAGYAPLNVVCLANPQKLVESSKNRT